MSDCCPPMSVEKLVAICRETLATPGHLGHDAARIVVRLSDECAALKSELAARNSCNR